ncbi:MAG TPA: hypothetical protein DCG06_08095 [Deltaproteobacteria bacterium]|nr:hypothetical protein [Deltaproteobacteria bacterium]
MVHLLPRLILLWGLIKVRRQAASEGSKAAVVFLLLYDAQLGIREQREKFKNSLPILLFLPPRHLQGGPPLSRGPDQRPFFVQIRDTSHLCLA